MGYQTLPQHIIGMTLATLLLVGCGAPASTPASEAPAATSTPVPSTATPTSEPPTATATLIPPTVTPTPIPQTATSTPIPPTATSTTIPPVGTDITIDLPEGNVDDGAFEARRWGCEECHITYTHGPLFLSSAIGPSVSERAASRIEDLSYTGTATTAEEYLVESILLPKVYLVEGYENREQYAMDDDLGERLTAQDVADILAWLFTIE